jgi:hypothetical protein
MKYYGQIIPTTVNRNGSGDDETGDFSDYLVYQQNIERA